MKYGFMEPKKKRRNLFSTEEYENAKSLEEASWMANEETKFFKWFF